MSISRRKVLVGLAAVPAVMLLPFDPGDAPSVVQELPYNGVVVDTEAALDAQASIYGLRRYSSAVVDWYQTYPTGTVEVPLRFETNESLRGRIIEAVQLGCMPCVQDGTLSV